VAPHRIQIQRFFYLIQILPRITYRLDSVEISGVVRPLSEAFDGPIDFSGGALNH